MLTQPLRGLRVLAGLASPVPAHRADRPVDAPTLADHMAPTTQVAVFDGTQWLSPCAGCAARAEQWGLDVGYLARHRGQA